MNLLRSVPLGGGFLIGEVLSCPRRHQLKISTCKKSTKLGYHRFWLSQEIAGRHPPWRSVFWSPFGFSHPYRYVEFWGSVGSNSLSTQAYRSVGQRQRYDFPKTDNPTSGSMSYQIERRAW